MLRVNFGSTKMLKPFVLKKTLTVNMYRLIKIFLLLTPIIFVSCLDVVEEIDLNSSNGGKATYTFNLSQSKIKLNTLLKLDSIGGHKIPKLYEIENELAKAVRELKSKEGISEASYTINEAEYIYTLEVSFASLKFLNNALKEMSYWQHSEWKPKKDFYKLENHILTKNIEAVIVPQNQKRELERRKESLVLGSYTFILRHTKELLLMSPTELKLSGYKKAVMYRNDLYQLSKNGRELILKAKVL